MGAFAHDEEYAEFGEDDVILAAAGFNFCNICSSRRSFLLPIAIYCAKFQITFVCLLQTAGTPTKSRGHSPPFYRRFRDTLTGVA